MNDTFSEFYESYEFYEFYETLGWMLPWYLFILSFLLFAFLFRFRRKRGRRLKIPKTEHNQTENNQN